MNKRKLLYIAAPYTCPDPVMNTHNVAKLGMWLYENTDYLPFIPHLNMLWHTVTPRSESFWYHIDLDYLNHCDALVRLPGLSVGADNEVHYCKEHGIEVIDFTQLPLEAQNCWIEGLWGISYE